MTTPHLVRGVFYAADNNKEKPHVPQRTIATRRSG